MDHAQRTSVFRIHYSINFFTMDHAQRPSVFRINYSINFFTMDHAQRTSQCLKYTTV